MVLKKPTQAGFFHIIINFNILQTKNDERELEREVRGEMKGKFVSVYVHINFPIHCYALFAFNLKYNQVNLLLYA